MNQSRHPLANISLCSQWRQIGGSFLPDGNELILYERDGEYSIRANGRELMSSLAHGSEERLAELACQHLTAVPRARVLIGGLGLGYTLAAALRVLPMSAEIVLSELAPDVLSWNRGPAGSGAGFPLNDVRVHTIQGDVCGVVAASVSKFDAILLDTDNGRSFLSYESNRFLYSFDGLRTARRALRGGGVLAIWSDSPDSELEYLLSLTGFVVSVHTTSARGRQAEPEHTILIGRVNGL